MYLTLEMMQNEFANDGNVRFREEIVNDRRVTIVCYMVSDDELWNRNLGLETRGPCFDSETGELIALPFEKFFNVNEKAHTQTKIIDAEMSRAAPFICEKLDGSMINAAMVRGKIVLKTKKSFYSDVALAAQANMTHDVEELSRFLIGRGFTPIFEYYSPDSQVVLKYGDKPRFSLIAARSMEDGTYLDQVALDYWAEAYSIERPVWYHSNDLGALIEMVENVKDAEGWVIYLPSGRYKIKTKWYMDRHRMLDIRERDIAKYVLDDVIDDMIPHLIEGQADMEVVRQIMHKIANDITVIRLTIDSLAAQAAKIPDGAERAAWVNAQTSPLKGFVFRQARGHDISDESLRDFYARHQLAEFSLRSIGNPNFRKTRSEDE